MIERHEGIETTGPVPAGAAVEATARGAPALGRAVARIAAAAGACGGGDRPRSRRTPGARSHSDAGRRRACGDLLHARRPGSGERVPALLEYLPYRKDDDTAL